jgi:hypothetical protein
VQARFKHVSIVITIRNWLNAFDRRLCGLWWTGKDEESVNLECTTLQQSQVGFIACRPCCVLCIILILGLLDVSCFPLWGCVYLLLRSIHSPCIFIQRATTLKSLSTLKSLPSNCSFLCGC